MITERKKPTKIVTEIETNPFLLIYFFERLLQFIIDDPVREAFLSNFNINIFL